MSLIRNNQSPQVSRLLFRVSAMVMVLMGIGALVFWKERLYGDSADYLFRMIQHESFFIVHSRPGSVFIEWLAWIGIQAGWPMEWIIRSLSLGEYLWFLLCFLFFAFVFRSRNHAVSLVLVYIFALRWNYFNPVSELLLAFPLFILLHFVWKTFNNRSLISNLLVSWTLAVFLFFCHPLYMLAVPVMLAWFWLDGVNKKDLMITGIGLAAGIALRYFFLDSYEKDPLSTMHVSLTPKAAFKRFIAIKTFIELGKCYAGTIFLLFASSFMLFKKQQVLKALLIPGFALAYFGLVAIRFGGLYPETFEPFERYLFIVPLLVVVVYQAEWLNWNDWKQALIVVFVAWHVFYIHRYSRIVTNRYEVFENALLNASQFSEEIIPIRKENYHPEFESNRIQGHDWIMSSESMLLSSLQGPKFAKQVYIKDIMPDTFYTQNHQGKYMYYTFGWMAPVDEINRRYIDLGKARWRNANTDSLQEYNELLMEKIAFEVLEMPVMNRKEKNVLTVRLKTVPDLPIYSGMKKRRVGLAYRLEQNGLVEEGKFLSPLMCDLVDEVRQRMIVVGPEKPGTYTFVPGWESIDGNTRSFYPFGERIELTFN